MSLGPSEVWGNRDISIGGRHGESKCALRRRTLVKPVGWSCGVGTLCT